MIRPKVKIVVYSLVAAFHLVMFPVLPSKILAALIFSISLYIVYLNACKVWGAK